MIKVSTKVKTNIDLDKYFNTLITGTKKVQKFIDANASSIANSITEMIAYEIYKQHPIGDFMVARTAIDPTFEPGSVNLQIHGIPENEVNDEYTEAWKSRTQKPVGQWYLWEFHEFGGFTKNVVMPSDSYPMHFEVTDPRYKEIYTYKRTGVTVTKYKGEVRIIISSMKFQLQKFIEAAITLLAAEQIVDQIEEASNKQIKPKIPSRILRNYQQEHQKQNEMAQAQGFKNRYERRIMRATTHMIAGMQSKIIRSQ